MVTLWNGNLSQTERLIWLTIEGVPVEAWNESSLSKITPIWGKVLGVEPAVGDKKLLTKGRVYILTKDFRWINDVVRVKVKRKFADVGVIENMEFNVDFDSESEGEDQSRWVPESSMDHYSEDLLMEDEQLGGEGKESLVNLLRTPENSNHVLSADSPKNVGKS